MEQVFSLQAAKESTILKKITQINITNKWLCIFFFLLCFKEILFSSKHIPEFWSWRGKRFKITIEHSLFIKIQLSKKILKDFFIQYNNTNPSTWYKGSFDATAFITMFYSCVSFVGLSLRIESATYNLILPLLVVGRERWYCFLIAVKQNEIHYMSVLLWVTNAVSMRNDMHGYFSKEVSHIWGTFFCYIYFCIFQNCIYSCGSKYLKYSALLSFIFGCNKW